MRESNVKVKHDRKWSTESTGNVFVHPDKASSAPLSRPRPHAHRDLPRQVVIRYFFVEIIRSVLPIFCRCSVCISRDHEQLAAEYRGGRATTPCRRWEQRRGGMEWCRGMCNVITSTRVSKEWFLFAETAFLEQFLVAHFELFFVVKEILWIAQRVLNLIIWFLIIFLLLLLLLFVCYQISFPLFPVGRCVCWFLFSISHASIFRTCIIICVSWVTLFSLRRYI